MSLALAAKHLESQGRHGDSQLVHMSTGEVKALRGLAQIHGGDLTINPKTGLPEAGFLSSILPTVAGIAIGAMTGNPLLAAGIVGLADYAITGSLSQGLMAGLSAWSGGSLAGDIKSLAGATTQTAATEGGNLASQLANANVNPALVTNATSFTPGVGALANTTGGLSNIGAVGTNAGGISGMFGGTVAPQFTGGISGGISGTGITSADALQANTSADAQKVASQVQQNTNAAKVATQPSNWDQFTSGAKNLWNDPSTYGKQLWNTPGAKMDIFGTAMPFVTGAMSEFQPKGYTLPPSVKNPFGLKTLSSEFQGYNPQGAGSPYFQAQYRNYQTNPYIPSAAGGGLQTIPGYAGKSDSFVKLGERLLKTQELEKAPIVPGDPGSAYGGPGIFEYEKEYEGMSPMDRTNAKMQALFGKKIAIKPVGALGAISRDPAAVAQQAIADEQAKQAQSAKEGGLQGYALGGLSMGNLGGYSDGGRLLKGPGDGVSDSIPASIGHKQPARLAEGEFVIPARIVSELGNGSTNAGAKRLYAMMDRIKAKRAKTKNIAADSKAYNLLPA